MHELNNQLIQLLFVFNHITISLLERKIHTISTLERKAWHLVDRSIFLIILPLIWSQASSCILPALDTSSTVEPATISLSWSKQLFRSYDKRVREGHSFGGYMPLKHKKLGCSSTTFPVVWCSRFPSLLFTVLRLSPCALSHWCTEALEMSWIFIRIRSLPLPCVKDLSLHTWWYKFNRQGQCPGRE